MAYHYSDIDTKNMKWMEHDNSCATLSKIDLAGGTFRGLGKFLVEFAYPIAAVAGENGSGKSTLLAIAACAFHNKKDGFKLSDRKTPYYTFSDFFIQSKDEFPPDGIHLGYCIRHDNWHGDEPGPQWQYRTKKIDGKWSNYDLRVKRNVVYFGIQRVVPHYERSTHRSYRKSFRPGKINPKTCESIREIAGRILGKQYELFQVYTHSKYSLPYAISKDVLYSGFNMGAGECAVFEILIAIHSSGRGTLIVVDELELGLHEQAQRRFIKELKVLCEQFHCQIICSTHSHIILDCLPPEGRFYIQKSGSSTEIIPGVSSAWACGNLAGQNSGEVDVFVEDDVAEAILQNGLPLEIRNRIRIFPIGSFNAVLRVLAGHYLEKKGNCLTILDGDQRTQHQSSVTKVQNNVEPRNDAQKKLVRDWAEPRITYFPGDAWPEKWLIQSAIGIKDKAYLKAQWGISKSSEIIDVLKDSLQSGKHNEFWELAKTLQQSLETVRADVIRFVAQSDDEALRSVRDKVRTALKENT